MRTLWQDLRYGARTLWKNPGTTFVIIVALALGVGANTAIFSVVNAVLLRPLPFDNPEQLVVVWETNPARGVQAGTPSPPDFREWRQRTQAFEQMAAFYEEDYNLSGTGEPERLSGAVASANFFSTLKVNAAAGRTFQPDEEQFGAHRVAVLSHGLWQRRFGGNTQILGQTINLNNQPYTVIGIAPPDFQLAGVRAELWTPMAFAPGDRYNTRGNHFLNVVARLKPGMSIAQAQADMDVITRQLAEAHEMNAGLGAKVVPMHEEAVGSYRPALLVLLGAVGFVLLIACANVANLLLARSAARQKEFALRATLGASRLRTVRQLLTESLLLSVLGGGLGLLLAMWGVDLLVALSPAELPRVAEIGVDGRVLTFTLSLSVLTGIVFGLAPALQASHLDLNEALKEGGRSVTGGKRTRRLRGALVVAEIALSLVLLAGAGLLINSFWHLTQVSPGFKTDNLLTMQIALPESKYPPGEPHRVQALYRQLLERVATLPGVQSVGATSSLPLAAGGWGKLLSVEGRPAPPSLETIPLVQYRHVSANYFSTLGVSPVKGRLFTEQDNANSPPVALINEEMARRFFPGEDPVGKRIWMGPPESMLPGGALPQGYSFPRLTIAGVVNDVKHQGLNQQAGPEVYTPHSQGAGETQRSMFLAVRTTVDPLSLAAAVRNEVRAVDKDQPVADVQTMEQRLAASLAGPRFNMLLLGLFAAVALALAAVGLYGVMAYGVTQRTHEIGIRMALGAQRSNVLRLVVRQGMLMALVGVALGLAASFALTRVMASLLFGVSATDPLVFTIIALLLAVVAFIASYIPARRAIKVDPMTALRYE
jgi:putative ABC transport system permease protein